MIEHEQEKLNTGNLESETSQRNTLIFPPRYKILLEFSNINYKLKKGKKRHILKNCSGFALPGRFLAILGTSGAGKSSLLNILSGRLRDNKNYSVTGTIKLNGTSDCSKEAFQQNTKYVMQENLVFEFLKVKETLSLSSELMLSKKIPKKEKKKIVEKIIDLLDIKSCQNSLVGGEKIRGVSGGERKRVCIGNELITNPPLFFMDEPTSGLDSYTALKVIKILAKLAKTGRTIVATIHQPSSNIFHLFDDLMLISDGYITYMGPAKYAIEAFNKMGYPIQENSNPADHFLNVIVKKEENDVDRIQKISLQQKKTIEEINGGEIEITIPDEKIAFQKIDKPNTIEQVYILTTKRAFLNYTRNMFGTYIRLAQIIFFSLLCGVLFYQLENDIDGVFAKMGALFFILVNLTFNSVLNVILVFPEEKKVFMNQMSNGMYNIISYFLSKIIIEISGNYIFVIIYQLIIYWMVGFKNSPGNFFIMYLILSTTTQIGYFLGLFLGAISVDSDMAIALSTFVLLPSILFSGFFIPIENIVEWIGWATYINFFRYSMDMLVYNEFNGDVIIEECNVDGTICNKITGNDFLSTLELNNLNFWSWYGVLIGFGTFFCVLTLLVILIKTYNSIEGPLDCKEKSDKMQ